MRRTLTILALSFSFYASPLQAAIAFKGTADIGNNGTSGPLSGSYNVTGVTSRTLFANVQGDLMTGVDDVPAPTFNGVSMTLAVKITTCSAPSANRIVYLFYLMAPATGSHTFAIASSSHYLAAVLSDYDGIKQTGQPEATGTNSNSGSADLVTSLTTISDNSIIIMADGSYSGGSAIIPIANLIRRVYGATFGEPALLESVTAVHPAGSYSMTTSNSGASNDILCVVASFAPDTGGGGGGGGTPKRLTLLGVGSEQR